MLALCSGEIIVFSLSLLAAVKKLSSATTELANNRAALGPSAQQAKENGGYPVGRTHAAGWSHEKLRLRTMMRHYIFTETVGGTRATEAVGELAAAMSDAATERLLIAAVIWRP